MMPTLQAVRKAQELGLDLILIAPAAQPPVAKAVDYCRWRYEQKKRHHGAKKKQHVIQVKECGAVSISRQLCCVPACVSDSRARR
jgi:translation initiation factor IF-3